MHMMHRSLPFFQSLPEKGIKTTGSKPHIPPSPTPPKKKIYIFFKYNNNDNNNNDNRY